MQKVVKCCGCHKPLDGNLQFTIQNFICPYCGQQYADKPIQESNFFQSQDKFLINNDEKALAKMLLLIQEFAYNLICKRLKNSAVYLLEEDIEDKVAWCVQKCLGLYRNPEKNFKIEASLTGYINQMILYPLYNKEDQEKERREVSLFTPIQGLKDERKEITLLDKLSEESYLDGINELENFMYHSIMKDNVVKQVQDYIGTILSVAYKTKGYGYALKLVILYQAYFGGEPPLFFIHWWNTEGTEIRDFFEKTLTLLKKSLHEIQEN